MKVVLFGATGMIGSGALHECLADTRVDTVLAVGRTRIGLNDPKLYELIRTDFFHYSDMQDQLAGNDACFFCLGISSTGMNEADYTRVTHDLTLAAARAFAAANPGSTFCYISGEGADRSERSRIMWARVRGRTENHLLSLPLNVFVLRPGFVQPIGEVRSKTRLYQTFYTLAAPFYPMLWRLFARHMTTTQNIGRALIALAQVGYAKRILDNTDINQLAASSAAQSRSPRRDPGRE
jgi:uncharacterized protein YbjT (DUF2867 family)